MLSRSRVVLALVTGLVTGTGACLGVGMVLHEEVPPVRPVAARRAAPETESAAVSALRAWDVRRADAWARGDAAALRALYVPGSSAGAADVRLLRRWTARGLTVRGLREQVLQARVLEVRPGRLRLVVTERLTGGAAASGSERVWLPSGGTITREVVLRLSGDAWLVASVSVPPRAPP